MRLGKLEFERKGSESMGSGMTHRVQFFDRAGA